jgi:hypothetical protein
MSNTKIMTSLGQVELFNAADSSRDSAPKTSSTGIAQMINKLISKPVPMNCPKSADIDWSWLD